MIIPEADCNLGWEDIANKILHFLGKQSTSRSRLPPTHQAYADTTKISRSPVTKLPARTPG